MASTEFRRVASFSAGGYNVNLESRTTANFSRSNNTLSVSGAKVDVRFANDSVSTSFYGFNIVGSYVLPQGTNRRNNTGISSGTWYRGDTKSTKAQSFTVTVSANATSISTNNGAGVDSASWGGRQTMTIPALGAPSGLAASATAIAATTATLNASISNWGANATAGTGQRIEWRADSTQTWTNEAYSTSKSQSRAKTGLTSNEKYHVRSYAVNGGGKATSMPTPTVWYTLPLAFTMGTPTVGANTVSIPVSQNAGGGHYVITRKYRYMESGGTYGAWTVENSGSIDLSGLSPSTKYYVQAQSSTTAGTTDGDVISFTTGAPPVSLPTVTSGAPDDIEITSITAAGNVTSDGTGTITERGVVVSKNPSPTTADMKFTTSGTTGPFTLPVTGLEPGTGYHYRAYVINEAGTGYGDDQQFTTLPDENTFFVMF